MDIRFSSCRLYDRLEERDRLRMVILGVTNPFNQPFARELWVTDPLAWLAEIRAPVPM